MPDVRHRWFDRWTLIPLIGVGTFMFWGAGHYSVFDDEGFSCLRYTMPLDEMVPALWHGAEPDPPLYYILQNIWVHLFGVGPLGLRSLSILMFLAGLIFTRLAATEWYDAPTGRLAMLIAAVHPAHLLFGFAGRWYSTMSCLVALLVWLTGVLARRGDGPIVLAWSFCAATVCYTNYFGVVIVGFLLIVFLPFHPHRMRWVKAAIGVFTFYAIWIPAFWRQATSFPQPAVTTSEFAASGLRTLGALATGNLAATSAWWIWVAFLVFSLTFLLLLKVRGQRSWPHPLGMVVCLSLMAGIVTRTLIDKYVMTISGLLIVVAASGWLSTWRADERPWIRRCLRLVAISLAVTWVGCYFNLVSQRHWSSLRWLDPWEKALRELTENPDSPLPQDWAMSQPAARYYFGSLMARRVEPEGKIRPDLWRRFALTPESGGFVEAAATPESMLERMKTQKPARLATVRGAEFADSPEWTRLQAILDREYEVADERKYLSDPDAKWKDHLDPAFKHPEWRITVHVYARKTRQ